MVKLKKTDRHQRILAQVRRSVTVRISDLAREFSVTTETVRRDLKELDRKGLLDRTYGGAAGSLSGEPPLRMREMIRVEERVRIARTAAGLVGAGDMVMIDAGSTTVHFARALALRDAPLHVVTNCAAVASILGRNPHLRVTLCPGRFDVRENSVFGTETCGFLSRFRATTAFIGAAGVDVEGPTETHSDAGWVKRAMIQSCDRTVLLVDGAKFNLRRMERICPWRDVGDAVVDRAPDPALALALTRADVTVHLAGPAPGKGRPGGVPK